MKKKITINKNENQTHFDYQKFEIWQIRENMWWAKGVKNGTFLPQVKPGQNKKGRKIFLDATFFESFFTAGSWEKD